jgi:hypothetical protein
MDIDVGQLVYPSLKDCPDVVDLHELSPVGRRATGGRDWRRLERFAQMREDLPDRPRIGNERDESDVTTTPRALQRKLLSHPGHEFGLWRRDGSRTTLRTRPPLIASDREYTPARSADKHLPEAHLHGSSILSSAVTATGTTVCAAWTSGTAK